jgi:hypothetical protein
MSHACACLPFSFFSRPLRLTQRAPPRAASRLPESPVQRAFSAPACKPTRLRAPAASATTVRRAQRRRLACRARLASRVQERPRTASATALRRPAPFVRPAIPTTCLMCVLRCARPVALKRVTSLLWPWRAGREGAAVAASAALLAHAGFLDWMLLTQGSYCDGGSAQPKPCTAPAGNFCPAGSSGPSGTICPIQYFCTGGTADKQVRHPCHPVSH